MIQQTISPTEIASPERLATLEKRYHRSRKKIRIILLIPALWMIGAAVAASINELWVWQALVGWCLLVLFLVGVYILYQVPGTDDVVHQYAMEILPGLFRKAGADEVHVAKRHDLSMKTFLEAGLYYDKYSSISREDCIGGKINGSDFGMYEIAIQVKTMTDSLTSNNGIATNHFYGWFIVVSAPRISGFHFVTMRRRVNSGESDDWHKKTVSHWESNTTFQEVATDDRSFNEAFLLNSDHPAQLLQLLNPSLCGYLMHLAETTSNSFAVSIQRGHVYLLIGHENADLRKCPSRNFATEIDPQLADNVRWYVELIKGFQKINLR